MGRKVGTCRLKHMRMSGHKQMCMGRLVIVVGSGSSTGAQLFWADHTKMGQLSTVCQGMTTRWAGSHGGVVFKEGLGSDGRVCGHGLTTALSYVNGLVTGDVSSDLAAQLCRVHTLLHYTKKAHDRPAKVHKD